jgi:hypothetical protein
VAVLVTLFQVVNRSAISRRYSSVSGRWRPGRKCGDIPLKADKNRWACPGEVNRFMARSRWRVGWWESGRCGALLRRTPLRTVHATRRRTRLKQAPRACG